MDGSTGPAIELKTEKEKSTDSQDDWINWLTACGFLSQECHGLDEAKNAFREYLE